MVADNLLKHSWFELKSDPGVFKLIIEDLGVRGVDIQEIYTTDDELRGVYGFILLYNLNEGEEVPLDESAEFVTDEQLINRMFFASQSVPNSCATHSLLSVLLNRDDCDMSLGTVLDELKDFARGMTPENKGQLINNCAQFANAHNARASHVDKEYRRMELYNQAIEAENRKLEKKTKTGTKKRKTGNVKGRKRGKKATAPPESDEDESGLFSPLQGDPSYHFCAFVPIDGVLYELDTLEGCPFSHGAIPAGTPWEEMCMEMLKQRFQLFPDQRYNLMALVPSVVRETELNIQKLEGDLMELRGKQKESADKQVQEAEKNKPEPVLVDLDSSREDEAMDEHPPESGSQGDGDRESALKSEIGNLKQKKVDVKLQLAKYKLEDQLRRFNFEPFVIQFSKELYDDS